MRKTFALLTDQDWKSLLSRATEKSYKNNDLIIAEGSVQSNLYLILSGFVHITGGKENSKLTLDRLGPNEVFGEMSFLENAPASASVVAEDNVIVQQIESAHLNSLLASDHGFSSRFYNSLAITLSERLRDLQTNQKELNINEIAQVNRFHSTRLGHITHRQIPVELKNSIHEFDAATLELEEKLSKGGNVEESTTKIQKLCDNIVESLNHFTQSEFLLKMGFEDLMSFRDTDQLDIGIGAYIFRETFPKFMLSETMAHCYMKPRGFIDDFKVNELIYANQPWGDGQLGSLIDQWFLERDFCSSRREDQSYMTDFINNKFRNSTSILNILSLASGSGFELFTALKDLEQEKIRATLIDIDQEALEHANELGNKIQNNNHTLSYINQNIIGVLEGRVQFQISQQNIIYATGFCDYLLDDQLIELLNWMYKHLKIGGQAVINVTTPSHPDRNLLTHILEWVMHNRTQEDLELLISRSTFTKAIKFRTNTFGISTFAILEK